MTLFCVAIKKNSVSLLMFPLLLFTPWEFFISEFEWQKSLQVSRTLLSILAFLSNAKVWMVSTRLFIFKSSSPIINPFVTVPRAPIITYINATFMFHSFFCSLARSRFLSFFWFSFNFILRLAGTAKSTILQVLFFAYYKVWSSGRV